MKPLICLLFLFVSAHTIKAQDTLFSHRVYRARLVDTRGLTHEGFLGYVLHRTFIIRGKQEKFSRMRQKMLKRITPML